MPPLTPARRIMNQHGIDATHLARLLSIRPKALSRYLGGERGITDTAHADLIEQYGSAGVMLSHALSDARNLYLSTHPLDTKKRQRYAAKPEPVKTHPEREARPSRRGDAPNPPDKDWDGKLYTFAEWRAQWGHLLDTNGVDQNGRIWGCFPSEPDFLGE